VIYSYNKSQQDAVSQIYSSASRQPTELA